MNPEGVALAEPGRITMDLRILSNAFTSDITAKHLTNSLSKLTKLSIMEYFFFSFPFTIYIAYKPSEPERVDSRGRQLLVGNEYSDY